jgi:hypothetical protein
VSFEYRIHVTGGPVSLARVGDRLRGEGLVVVHQAESETALAHASVLQEQVDRWGGEVVVSKEDGGLFVRLLFARDRGYLAVIVEEIESQGLKGQVEEV